MLNVSQGKDIIRYILKNYSEFNVENRKEVSESGYGETTHKEAILLDQARVNGGLD